MPGKRSTWQTCRRSVGPELRQRYPQFPAQRCRRTRQRRERDIALRIEQAIKLRAAGAHQLCHPGLSQFLPLHSLRHLPGNDFLDGDSLELRADTFGVEKLVQRRTTVRVPWSHFATHGFTTDLRRLAARSRALLGIFLVLFSKACNAHNSPS